MKSLVLLLLMCFAIGANAQNTITLSGKIDNPKKDWTYLRMFIEGSPNPISVDSCKLKDGNFRLSTEIDSLTQLQFWDGNEWFMIFMAPGENMSLSVNTQFFDESLMFYGTGSKRNNMMKTVYIAEEICTLSKNPYYLAYQKAEEKDTTKLFEKVDQFDSTLIAYFKYEQTQFPEMAKVLQGKIDWMESNSKKIKKRFWKSLKMEEMKVSEKGKQFMDFEGIDLDGNEVKLSNHYGQLMVLDFWATWCGPCKAEFDGLHELEKAYEGKVTFVSVAVWCKEEDWRAMAIEEGFKNNIFLEKEVSDVLKEKYLLTSIPRYIILDAEGKLLNLTANRPSLGLADELDGLLN